MDQELVGMWAQVGIGVGQLLLIAWGLQRMGVASAERNRQLDRQEGVLAELMRSSQEQREEQREQREQQREESAELLRSSREQREQQREESAELLRSSREQREEQREEMAELLRRSA